MSQDKNKRKKEYDLRDLFKEQELSRSVELVSSAKNVPAGAVLYLAGETVIEYAQVSVAHQPDIESTQRHDGASSRQFLIPLSFKGNVKIELTQTYSRVSELIHDAPQYVDVDEDVVSIHPDSGKPQLICRGMRLKLDLSSLVQESRVKHKTSERRLQFSCNEKTYLLPEKESMKCHAQLSTLTTLEDAVSQMLLPLKFQFENLQPKDVCLLDQTEAAEALEILSCSLELLSIKQSCTAIYIGETPSCCVFFPKETFSEEIFITIPSQSSCPQTTQCRVDDILLERTLYICDSALSTPLWLSAKDIINKHKFRSPAKATFYEDLLHTEDESHEGSYVEISIQEKDFEFVYPSGVRDYIKGRGMTSGETQGLLKLIGSRVQTSLNTKLVWAGYRPGNLFDPIFVAIVRGETDKCSSFETFEVFTREEGVVSGEGKYLSELEVKDTFVFTLEERFQIKDWMAKHTSRLMQEHGNIQIISASGYRSKAHGTPQASIERHLCIVLYVFIKGIIPYGEEEFPRTLDGIEIDVREGFYEEFSDPDARKFHQHLLMGCRISTVHGLSGTLGGFVRLPNGRIGCLTAWHLFRAITNKLQTEVFQPDCSTREHVFGHAIKVACDDGSEDGIGVDAALIEITEHTRHPVGGSFPNATSEKAGFSDEHPMKFTSGNTLTHIPQTVRKFNVLKYGARTGHTMGCFRLDGTGIRKPKHTYYLSEDTQESYTLHNQLEVRNIGERAFSDFGDSGSLVLTTDGGGDTDILAVGLLVGGTSYNTTIVTPIWAVLDKLGLPRELFSFPEMSPNHFDEHLEMKTEQTTQNATEERMIKIETKLQQIDQNVSRVDQRVEHLESAMNTGFQAILQTLSEMNKP